MHARKTDESGREHFADSLEESTECTQMLHGQLKTSRNSKLILSLCALAVALIHAGLAAVQHVQPWQARALAPFYGTIKPSVLIANHLMSAVVICLCACCVLPDSQRLQSQSKRWLLCYALLASVIPEVVWASCMAAVARESSWGDALSASVAWLLADTTAVCCLCWAGVALCDDVTRDIMALQEAEKILSHKKRLGHRQAPRNAERKNL